MQEWFPNRPKKYVKDCLEKIELANEVNTNNLFNSEKLQTFTVTSSANPEKFYDVFLSDDLRIPFCQSFEWKKNFLPCKKFISNY